MKLLCWLGLHRWTWNQIWAFCGDRFCVRKGCYASKSTLTGNVYKRQPLFAPKS